MLGSLLYLAAAVLLARALGELLAGDPVVEFIPLPIAAGGTVVLRAATYTGAKTLADAPTSGGLLLLAGGTPAPMIGELIPAGENAVLVRRAGPMPTHPPDRANPAYRRPLGRLPNREPATAVAAWTVFAAAGSTVVWAALSERRHRVGQQIRKRG